MLSIGVGNSSLFSPTANYELYQGTALTDQARNTVRSRDNFEVDKFLKNIADNSGGGSGGSGEYIAINLENSDGVALAKGTPLYVKPDGTVGKALPETTGNEAHVIGIYAENTLDSSEGLTVLSGRIEDVLVLGNMGDYVFLSKTGTLTTTPPDTSGSFVSGDAVVRLGKLVQNENDELAKDLIVEIDLIGFL